MFQVHLKSCGYCQNIDRATKQAELGHMIKGIKVASGVTATRSYSNTDSNANANDQLKKAKLRELVKIVGGVRKEATPTFPTSQSILKYKGRNHNIWSPTILMSSQILPQHHHLNNSSFKKSRKWS
jgi:hypothetical protein